MNTIQKFLQILSSQIKRRFVYLVFFTIVVAIFDLVGLSLLMPFITLVGNSDFIQDTAILNSIYSYFNFESHSNFVMAFGILLLGFTIIRFIASISYYYLSSRYVHSIANTIMVKLFNNYMYMEYKKFTSKNTSFLTKALLSETLNVSIAYYD